MPLTIIRNDITKMTADAIVNAANTSLKKGGGVCGAIFNAAGADELQAACNDLSPIKTGEAVITQGYALSAKYIIHTAGPIYKNGKRGEDALLRSCYTNALNLAVRYDCKSIAFPLISSGIYGYPKDEVLTIASSAIGKWLMANDEIDVFLVVFDKASYTLSKKMYGKVESFIKKNYVDEREAKRHQRLYEDEQMISFHEARLQPGIGLGFRSASEPMAAREKREGFREQLDEPFTDALLKMIDAKGKTDVEVYKKANIDRKLFSKIRTGKGYMPSKKTAVALAMAMELSLAETHDFLKRAGYALSRSVLFDVIIEYFIKEKKYDIFEINNVLFEYDQPLLGG